MKSKKYGLRHLLLDLAFLGPLAPFYKTRYILRRILR